jgi:hypothetical protein
MDKNGVWKVRCHHWMENDSAKFEWALTDPNGNEAGKHDEVPATYKGGDSMKSYIESINRPFEHSMPFGVTVWTQSPTNSDDAQSQFIIEKEMQGCMAAGSLCKPTMWTENKPETKMFKVDSCYQLCKDPNDAKLVPSDLDCEDMNDADWSKTNTGGWERWFNCHWKGF